MAGNYRFYCLLLFRFCQKTVNETSGDSRVLKGHKCALMHWELWVYFTVLVDANSTDFYSSQSCLSCDIFFFCLWGQSSHVESNHPWRLPLNTYAELQCTIHIRFISDICTIWIWHAVIGHFIYLWISLCLTEICMNPVCFLLLAYSLSLNSYSLSSKISFVKFSYC